MPRNLSSEGICESIINKYAYPRKKSTSVSHPTSKLHRMKQHTNDNLPYFPNASLVFWPTETPPKPPMGSFPTQGRWAASRNPHLICRRFLWEQHDLKLSSCLHDWTNWYDMRDMSVPVFFTHFGELAGVCFRKHNPCFFFRVFSPE